VGRIRIPLAVVRGNVAVVVVVTEGIHDIEAIEGSG